MTPLKLCVMAAGLAALAWAADIEEHEKIHKTFSGAKSIEIDNVNGSIQVVASKGPEIEADIEKTLHADDSSRAEAAKREVKLDVSQVGGDVKLYVDGPFRCHCDNGGFRSRNNTHEWRHRGYRMDYDFQIKVPAGTKLYLSTVNHGSIKVSNTSGDFDVENINGGIEMVEIAGSGQVHAINGRVNVVFAKNPERASLFSSLNGGVDISFQPDLNADARVKTMNGGIYTDFPVTYLPVVAATPQRRDGKFVYRSNEFTGVRIGRGGPEYKFDTLNGSIRIINRGK
ncbi:MAG: hypothetical protein ACR2NN_13110 [Bryobacteraceae bacterium]